MSFMFFLKLLYVVCCMLMVYYVACHTSLFQDDVLNDKTYTFSRGDQQILMNQYEFALSKQLSVPSNTETSVIGHSDILNEVESIVKLLRVHQNSASTIVDPPNGILLYGPPGTGKTTIAK